MRCDYCRLSVNVQFDGISEPRGSERTECVCSFFQVFNIYLFGRIYSCYVDAMFVSWHEIKVHDLSMNDAFIVLSQTC